jgi:hypothetical protein
MAYTLNDDDDDDDDRVYRYSMKVTSKVLNYK